MTKPKKLYEGNMRRNYFFYALPLILSALLAQSYGFINSIMIGKFIGSTAFAATAVSSQFTTAIESVFWGYLTGIGIYISVLFGQNERKRMLGIIKFNLLLSSLLALGISSFCVLFCDNIFALLNVGSEVYSDAKLYFCTYISGLTLFQLSWGFTYIANALGLTAMPLITSIITGILNIAGNYIFLVVLQKGIEYCALSTVIATTLSSVFYLIVFVRLFKAWGISHKGFLITKNEIRHSCAFGFPTMFQQIAMYACGAVVAPLVNTCSTAAISGYEIANKAKTLICEIYQNSSKANTTLVAQAMGAGRVDKLKQGIKTGITQSLIIFGIVMTLFVVFAEDFSLLFLDPQKDSESIRVSVNIIRFFLPLITFNVFNNLFHGIFRAIGSGVLLLVSTLIYAIAFIAYAYIFFGSFPYDIKIYGIYAAMSAAYITEVIFAVIIFATGKWKTAEYKMLEEKSKTI